MSLSPSVCVCVSLGAEHVKPTNPDFIDSKFTVASCDWIISELLRIYHKRDPSKINEIIQKVKSSKTAKLSSFETPLANQIDNLSIPDLILVILRTKSPQTKSEIAEKLGRIGRDVGSWLKGGNINSRLIKKGLIFKQVKKENKEDLYSLTVKGTIQAEKLIEMIKTEN